MSRLRIGDAARAAGVNVQTLHYYERQGLIADPARTPAGYREYEPSTIRTVRAIKRAQVLGFTLREIKELIAFRERSRSGQDLVAFAEKKIAEVDAKIAALRKIRRGLRQTIETCRCGGDVSRCNALEGLGGP